MRLSQFLPRFWMVWFSCSPVSLMVLWSWCCAATTTPYLLIEGSDRVFCVDCSILFVVIVRPPFRLLMTHVIESFLLVSFVFLGSDDRSSGIRGWFRNLQRRVCSWWFPDIRCFMQILPAVGNHTNRPVYSRCMPVDIVPICHWSSRSAHPFVDGRPCWVSPFDSSFPRGFLP